MAFMRSKYLCSALVLLASLTLSLPVLALDPQPVRLGDSLKFEPTLQVSERYDDNFRAVDSGKESSWITRIAPTFSLGQEGRKAAYKVSYTADSDIFHSSRKDDNTDHHFSAKGAAEFNDRQRLRLNMSYDRTEETASQYPTIANDKITNFQLGGVYTYGARTARLQVEMAPNYSSIRYRNANGLNDDKEYDSPSLRSTVFYRVAPKTRLLAEARYAHFKYVSYDLRNNDTVAYLGGVEWIASEMTSATIKLGAEQKRFEQSGIETKNGTMWEVGAKWSPRTYSTFRLNSRQELDEGDEGPASSVKAQTWSAGWEHKWLERFRTDLGYRHANHTYQDYGREDVLDGYSIGAKYAMRRWLDLGVRFEHVTNDSTIQTESYKRNILVFSINSSL